MRNRVPSHEQSPLLLILRALHMIFVQLHQLARVFDELREGLGEIFIDLVVDPKAQKSLEDDVVVRGLEY